MKKTITVIAFVVAVFACHRKTIPDSNIIISNKPIVREPTKDTKAETPKVDAAHTDLGAQGKTVFINRCGRCHALKNTADYTPQRWNGILKEMIPKARLNDDEAKQVTAYVMENAKK